MLLSFSPLFLGFLVLSVQSVLSISASDHSNDIPLSQLISLANTQLAAGNSQGALSYFDIAISRDTHDYLTLFKRGATYLSLGKSSLAHRDFDRALAVKPNFEEALLQRAKLHSRNAEWEAAQKDYKSAGKIDGPEVQALHDAQQASNLAFRAEEKRNWDVCVSKASEAIMVAGSSLELRKSRSRCRLENGETLEAMRDLQQVLRVSSGDTQLHLQVSAMMFYSAGETEMGLGQAKKCLQFDPDSKSCLKMMKRQKLLASMLTQTTELFAKRQFRSAVQLLIPWDGKEGLIKDVKKDINMYKKEGVIHKRAPDGLYNSVVEMACEMFVELEDGRSHSFCIEVLSFNPNFLPAIIDKVERQLDADEFEAAIHTLNTVGQTSQRLNKLRRKAQTLLKRSKSKDYYKILGVPRDADERTIKKTYRQLTKQFHPDKAKKMGISKEEAEKKMASLNEAYEVLGDPELRQRFDNGDDPNDQEQSSPFHGSPFSGGQNFFFRQGNGANGGFKFQQNGGFPGGFDFFS